MLEAMRTHVCKHKAQVAEPIQVTSAPRLEQQRQWHPPETPDDEGPASWEWGWGYLLGGGPTDRWQGPEEHRGP